MALIRTVWDCAEAMCKEGSWEIGTKELKQINIAMEQSKKTGATKTVHVQESDALPHSSYMQGGVVQDKQGLVM